MNKYSFNDIMIVPERVSNISSRKECNPLTKDGYLPIFTAPMSCVINEHNFKSFKDNKIQTIIPRTVDINIRLGLSSETFVALSLNEVNTYLSNEKLLDINKEIYICIDIANGHMADLLSTIKRIKTNFSNVIIMAGNIANPVTYLSYDEVGCDYVRVGIGGGSGCTTSSNTGVHYPMASLIEECYTYKRHYNGKTAIVADGNIKNYSDINKALALGADYVMCGSFLAQTYEAASNLYIDKDPNTPFNGNVDEFIKLKNLGYEFKRDYYGMSTKRAQREMGNEILKTAEGLEKRIDVTYTLSGLVENISDYIKSAMSYTNSKTLYEYIGKPSCIQITNNSFNRINI